MTSGSDSWSNRRFKGFSTCDDIVNTFSDKFGPTGFIFCLDELSKVKQQNYAEFKNSWTR